MSRFHSKTSKVHKCIHRRFTNIAEFDFLSELGRGGYSVVHLVRHKESGKKYALKCAMRIKKGKDRSSRTREEIRILSMLDHPNIIKIKGSFEDEDNIYLVLEYLSGGDLSNFFRNNLPSKDKLVKMVSQIIKAVEYCHQKDIIHRDIKLENILIDKNSNIKLTDFGLCAVKENKEYFYDEVGTARYTAPEILSGKGYDGCVDVWGIGIILFLLLTGEYPFNGSNRHNIFARITNKRINYTRYDLSNEEIHLLKRLLCKNPRYRIKLQDILQTFWFRQNKVLNNDDESNTSE